MSSQFVALFWWGLLTLFGSFSILCMVGKKAKNYSDLGWTVQSQTRERLRLRVRVNLSATLRLKRDFQVRLLLSDDWIGVVVIDEGLCRSERPFSTWLDAEWFDKKLLSKTWLDGRNSISGRGERERPFWVAWTMRWLENSGRMTGRPLALASYKHA